MKTNGDPYLKKNQINQSESYGPTLGVSVGAARRTWLDGVLIEVSDSVLLQDVFVHHKVAGELGRLGQDGVGGVRHDVGRAALFADAVSAQHVHGRRLDGCAKKKEKNKARSAAGSLAERKMLLAGPMF